ncbi:MAG: hypothetical protein IKR25_04595 [Muribaculaceae bacterium]|nr:hypothetical protein [Muribaculaceae bacterium]
MKRIYTNLLLLLCVMGAMAQEADYVPLVQEGVRWVYRYSDVTMIDLTDPVTGEDYPGWEGRGDYAYYMEFRGDTIINGLTYKKLYRSMSRDFDERTLRPVACLREQDKRVTGFEGNDPTEYVFYDFNDMEAFVREKYSEWGEMYGEELGSATATPLTVTVGGQPRNAYQVYNCWGDWSLVIEGIGNDVVNLLCLGPMDAIPPCICPMPLGLARVEDLDGNLLYSGRYDYGPYTGKGSLELLNHIINVMLGREVFSRKWGIGTECCDVNADFVVDISDVNALITIMLQQ